MANVELRFIRGVLVKTTILGGLLVAFSLLVSGWFTLSAAVGVAVALSNLAFVQWISSKLVRAAKAGNTNSTPWWALLVLKLFGIFVLIWLLLAWLKLDAVGFVAGFSCFLPAIVLQAVLTRDDDSSEPES